MTSDPRPGDPGYETLRLAILDRRRSDRDMWRRLDQQFARSDQAIAALVDREREQVAAQIVADPVGDPPGISEPAAETAPPPSIDELAASSALGSPAHMEWRRQHSSPDRGIFT